ncbi:MAG: hypothetical protein RLZZ385_2683 [Pseudomonadota bacterium]|jgi:hypothetical protein
MNVMNTARPLLALLLLGLLSACGVSSVNIEGNFPTPNVQKLPLKLAVLYDDALREFNYIEYTETGQEEFDIRSGESVIQLFNAILPAMFEDVLFVESADEARAAGVDALFQPAIEEFQLALPYKTKLDVFEVWIKYNLRLLTPEGDYIADWVLTSYGKTPQEGFRSSEAAINEAAVVALRDLGSSFTLSFAQVPEVRDWLASR